MAKRIGNEQSDSDFFAISNKISIFSRFSARFHRDKEPQTLLLRYVTKPWKLDEEEVNGLVQKHQRTMLNSSIVLNLEVKSLLNNIWHRHEGQI